MKNFFKSIQVFVYFALIFLGFFIVGFYTYYKYKMPKPPYVDSKLYDLYSKDIILKTGGLLHQPQERFQHFLNFPAEKKKGAIRIGAFGDSHTFGDEVEKTATYPYYLQELFNKKLPNHFVEVLNFGVSAVGFPEQFFLWEKYAKAYQLDYVLLGPVGFYSARNTRFTFHNMSYWLPKNRFIITKKNQLRPVHIKGDTVQKRFENYYSLMPAWTALRYDKQPFKIYEILFPFLRYKIKNPFYYTKMSEDEEAVKINKQLLRKINESYPKKLLFFTNSLWLYQLYESDISLSDIYNHQPLGSWYNLNLMPFTSSFYQVFWHESSLGNRLIAQFYFNALLGKTRFFLNIIQCYFKLSDPSSSASYRAGGNDESIGLDFSAKSVNPIEMPSQKPVSEKAGVREGAQLESPHKNRIIDLDLVNKIKVLGQDTLLFNLRINASDHHHRGGSHGSQKKGTKSFLAFLNKKEFLRSVYIPLSFQLKEGMKVYIQLKNDKQIELGSTRPLDVSNKFFALYTNRVIATADYSYTHLFLYLSKKGLKIKERGELFIDNYKLGQVANERLHGKDLLKFIPNIGYSKTFLMMGPQDSIRETDFPKEFPVFINYQAKAGKNFKSLIPDWTCRKERQEINLNLPHFEPLAF
ncbi:MAG: hypothetical protein OXJ52_08465 [Oligoflexia bacterium]|nr:hypothetical protein [Oligoflexia bacterium]